MKQFKTILKFELNNYFHNKVFVGLTILLVLGIILTMNFPRLSKGINLDEIIPDENEEKIMLIFTNEEEDLIKETFTEAFPDYKVSLTKDDTTKIKDEILKNKVECAFVLDSITSYTYYVNNLSLYDNNPEIADAVLKNIYRTTTLNELGIDKDVTNAIFNEQINHEIENLGKDQAENFFYTYIMIFALYMVILLYGQMVASNVATEKSSRAMELLITSAKPTSMMFGKVIASCLAGLIQLLCIFGTAFICFNLNKGYWQDNTIIVSIFNMPLYLLIYMLLFFLLGFLIYAFLYAAVGSTVSKLEDINIVSMPITMVFLIGFMIVIFSLAGSNVDNALVKICSYIPFTSPVAMFTRIAMSTVPWYEVLISVTLLVVTVWFIGVLAAKIYRVGVLLYGVKPDIKSLIKSIWKA